MQDYLDKFIPADHLKKGDHLQTPNGTIAIADGGTTPKVHEGWMWDLTVAIDHDFYIDTIAAPVLVHNCDPGEITGYTKHGLNQAIGRDGHGVSVSAINDAVRHPLSVVKQANGTIRYVGQNAVVVLNSAGRVVTTWARNSAGWRTP